MAPLRRRIAAKLNPVTHVMALLQHVESRVDQAIGYGVAANELLRDFADRSLFLAGRAASRQLPRGQRIKSLSEVEFRVFSQWGEDGIIEWLISHVQVPNAHFIEFGVESFHEANCRFLLMNRNWKGLVMDSNEAHIAALQTEPLYWMYDLTAKPALVTAENVDELIASAGFGGPLGLLSIDIDGNDYWVWNAIKSIDPAIVVCEYNPIFGDTRAISVPYDPNFNRFSAHYSGLYSGCSIAALQLLASKRGYAFVGTNSNGINAFFVRNDLAAPVLANLQEVRAFASRHRNSRDPAGHLTYTGGIARLDLIRHLEVVDVATGDRLPLSHIDKPYSEQWLHEMQ